VLFCLGTKRGRWGEKTLSCYLSVSTGDFYVEYREKKCKIEKAVSINGKGKG